MAWHDALQLAKSAGGARASGCRHQDAGSRAAKRIQSVARARLDRLDGVPALVADTAAIDDATDFPLRTREDARAYLTAEGAPDVLVAYEFSGAILAVLRRTKNAMSVDKREAEHGMPSYVGDVRDIIDLRHWELVICAGPNCKQNMRFDKCLQSKLDDCRAFWGAAEVTWAICIPNAKGVIVEQPDTNTHDYLDIKGMPGVVVQELYTKRLGDKHDKFLRLTARDVRLPELPSMDQSWAGATARRPAHHEYANPEERDKARSSWLQLPKACEHVAAAQLIDRRRAQPLDYVTEIRKLGKRWPGPLPPGYDNPTGRPLTAEERAYQEVRGHGDGRRPGGVSHSEAAQAEGEAILRTGSIEGDATAAAARPAARRAEAGDQVVATSPDQRFFQMVDRKTSSGSALSKAQEVHLSRLEGYTVDGATPALYFWEAESFKAGVRACLSNYYQPVLFTDHEVPGELSFSSTEQYMHFLKAVVSGDDASAARILDAIEPRVCRALGRKVIGFEPEAWDKVSRQVVERGVYLKFHQDETLRDYLLGTIPAELVEASPYDARWGIGVPAHRADATPRVRWGSNWLGHALMRARARLPHEAEPSMPRMVDRALLRWAQRTGQGALTGGSRSTGVRLSAAMQRVNDALPPGKEVVDVGGGGKCGFHSLSRGAREEHLNAWTADEMRTRLVDHASSLLDLEDEGLLEGGSIGIRALLEAALASWTPSGVAVSAERWIAIMRGDRTWADQAILALAADLMRTEIVCYVVECGGSMRGIDTYEPLFGADTTGRITVVLEVDTHFCVVINTNGDAARVGGGDMLDAFEPRSGVTTIAGGAMVPTNSQWLIMLEESEELAKHHATAAFTSDEYDAIVAAITAAAKQQGEGQWAQAQLEEARKNSLFTSSLENQERELAYWRRRNQDGQGQPEVACDDDLELSDDESEWGSYEEGCAGAEAPPEDEWGPYSQGDVSVMVPNREVDAHSMDSESTNQGVAADAVAQADYDMASRGGAAPDVTAVGPSSSLRACSRRQSKEEGAHEWHGQVDHTRHERRNLSEDVRTDSPSLQLGRQHPEAAAASTRTRSEPEESGGSAQAQPADGDGLSMAAAAAQLEESTRTVARPNDTDDTDAINFPGRRPDPTPCPRPEVVEEGELRDGDVLVVPYAMAAPGPCVLVPAQENQVLRVQGEAPAAGVVERAQAQVQAMVPEARSTTGFAAGTHLQGTRLVVVAADVNLTGLVERKRAGRRTTQAVAGLVWCVVTALSAATLQTRMANLAVAAASHFTTYDGATTTLLKQEMAWRHATGMEAGRTAYLGPRRPLLRAEDGTTPLSLLTEAQQSLDTLRAALRQHGGEHATYFEEWADAIKPINIGEVTADLLETSLALGDAVLAQQLFAPPLPVYETPWLERAPRQQWHASKGCEDYTPLTVTDLIDEEAQRDLRAWFRDFQRDAKCLEELGEACDRRDKPSTIAIGQDQTHECARGYLWDCRQSPCVLLDYEAPISSDFDLDELARRFVGYADQRLASNILQGVRLEADLDLVSQFNPQLASIGAGYDSVQKTVRELRDLDFYDFLMTLAFWPIIVVGQGSRIKKLGVKKYRRTSNFSGPHKLVTDKRGRRAVPVNEASKCYIIPEWLAQARDAETRRWARDKYAHVPAASRASESAPPHHKFPKERKPSLSGLMRDIAILLVASRMLGEPIFIWVEDAAFYFCQLGYGAEELWKSNLIVSARPGDVAKDGASFKPGQLVFVSEKRLGFGSYASSNIAQRFSNALTGWVLEEFDKMEMEARRANPNERWEDWIRLRKPLEDRCRQERPKRSREALSDCTQTRLAVLTMWTDDPASVVVGVARTVRLLEAWRKVTRGINLIMAGPEKRQLGSDVEWIGVFVLAAIGLVAIPKNKLLRARDAIQRTLNSEITFGEYRALVGLLEHLRFVSQLAADATNVLYEPHKRESSRGEGPNATVQVNGLMHAALRRWLHVIGDSAGAVVTVVFRESAEARLLGAAVVFAASSDAAGDGRGEPGLGGYLHGYYWRVALPVAVLAAMHITGWETLAACINILVAARLAGGGVMLALQVDALLTPYAVGNQRSRSQDIQRIIFELLEMPDYRSDVAPRLALRHCSGDGNVAADAVSRALWCELAELCEALQVRPMHVTLVEREVAFLVRCVLASAEARHMVVTASEVRGCVLTAPPRELGEREPRLRDGAMPEPDWGHDPLEAEARRPSRDPRRRLRSDDEGGTGRRPRAPRREAFTIANEAVEAAARHGTSVHLGLAADSVAQADYDMASVAAGGGGENAELQEYMDLTAHPAYVAAQPHEGAGEPELLYDGVSGERVAVAGRLVLHRDGGTVTVPVDQHGRAIDPRSEAEWFRDHLRVVTNHLNLREYNGAEDVRIVLSQAEVAMGLELNLQGGAWERLDALYEAVCDRERAEIQRQHEENEQLRRLNEAIRLQIRELEARRLRRVVMRLRGYGDTGPGPDAELVADAGARRVRLDWYRHRTLHELLTQRQLGVGAQRRNMQAWRDALYWARHCMPFRLHRELGWRPIPSIFGRMAQHRYWHWGGPQPADRLIGGGRARYLWDVNAWAYELAQDLRDRLWMEGCLTSSLTYSVGYPVSQVAHATTPRGEARSSTQEAADAEPAEPSRDASSSAAAAALAASPEDVRSRSDAGDGDACVVCLSVADDQGLSVRYTRCCDHPIHASCFVAWVGTVAYPDPGSDNEEPTTPELNCAACGTRMSSSSTRRMLTEVPRKRREADRGPTALVPVAPATPQPSWPQWSGGQRNQERIDAELQTYGAGWITREELSGSMAAIIEEGARHFQTTLGGSEARAAWMAADTRPEPLVWSAGRRGDEFHHLLRLKITPPGDDDGASASADTDHDAVPILWTSGRREEHAVLRTAQGEMLSPRNAAPPGAGTSTVVSNAQVRGWSMHSESVHQGVAADSVAQADYDMASLADADRTGRAPTTRADGLGGLPFWPDHDDLDEWVREMQTRRTAQEWREEQQRLVNRASEATVECQAALRQLATEQERGHDLERTVARQAQRMREADERLQRVQGELRDANVRSNDLHASWIHGWDDLHASWVQQRQIIRELNATLNAPSTRYPHLRARLEGATAARDAAEQRAREAEDALADLQLWVHNSHVVPNEEVEAQAMHATSVHLGLAADSVAQADYDMASVGDDDATRLAREFADAKRAWAAEREQLMEQAGGLNAALAREALLEQTVHMLRNRAELAEGREEVYHRLLQLTRHSNARLRRSLSVNLRAPMLMLTKQRDTAELLPLEYVTPNELVDAESRHSESVHLGVAADSVAQADYDMASVSVYTAEDDATSVRVAFRKCVSQADRELTSVSIYAEADDAPRTDYYAIGEGLFSLRGFEAGECVAAFVQDAMMELEHWGGHCQARGLPQEWAGFLAERNVGGSRRTVRTVMLYDQSWQGMAHHERPRWCFMNHDKDPNCEAIVPRKGANRVRFVTTRGVQPGEELTFDYHGNTDFGDDPDGGEPPPDPGDGKRKRPPAGAYRFAPPKPTKAAPARAGAADTPLAQEVIRYLGRFVPAWATVRPRVKVVCHRHMPRSGVKFQPAWAKRPGRVEHECVAPVAREAKRPRAPTPYEDAPPNVRPRHPYMAPAYTESKLRSDQLGEAKALAERLAKDNTPGRIDAPRADLEEMALAVAEARADGINPRTSSKDAFALREFEAYAALRGFDPNLRTEWTRRFPERESLKLAAWLLWRAQRAVPRSRKGVAKPMSIYQNYLALRRVFRSRDVELPPSGTVRETLKGLIRRFIRRFGIGELRPKRVEPVTPALIRKCLQLTRDGTAHIKGRQWTLSSWVPFIVTAWMIINLSIGSRKGESTELTGDVDENDWFVRAAVTYWLNGRTYVDPPVHALLQMKEGDHAALAPQGSKCDQYGTCHGTEPIILPYHDDDMNAAKWLRDVEVRHPVHGATRKTTPLFADEQGRPFKDATFAGYVMGVLTAVVGETRAQLLSPHSWRVWLASSLRMCGATDARIQAMGRWLNPDSVKIYARMTKQEYAAWVDKLMAVKRIDTARTTSLPVMDLADAISAWGKQLHVDGDDTLERWNTEQPAAAAPARAPATRGARVAVYWTDMGEWYEGTYQTSRVEKADGGGTQRASCILYDAVGQWESCNKQTLTYWHCLDDEQWRFVEQ